ncbi:MAG TPA: class I SAM-dependent methyltransferase [Candidatus Eisenbacteria bacterium]|nr:class I SAM-dependent methyltransferase [Candidatus Eisenbacteria bacterium]
MTGKVRALGNKIHRLLPSSRLNPDKKQLIDFACQRLNMRSFADLGAVWNVDGGYTFYAMERHDIQNAVMVDTDLTPRVLKKQKAHPGLRIIQGNFGDPLMPERIGKVDGVFFFDTLLHQVKPNWDEVLQMYARVSDILLIFNQQYTNLSATTRLLDLGRDEYFRNVPVAPHEEPYKTYFRDLDAIHPQHRRPYRDIHNIWQWGIVDADLISCATNQGFKMQFYKNCGQFGKLKNVENHAFVFSRPQFGQISSSPLM